MKHSTHVDAILTGNNSIARAMMLCLGLLCAPTTFAAEKYAPNWESLDSRPCPEWFLDAKFGIFIHWGVYSVPAWGAPGQYAEWYWWRINEAATNNLWRDFHNKNFGPRFDYHEFAPQFRAELFDANKWADLFVRSGAKYIVPTSKHHDGFCLWPSTNANTTWGRPWNSVDVGPKRDLLGELSGSCRARGLKFGFYYSLYEWFNPVWRADRPKYIRDHMIPQFKDVVTRYRPAIIFSDGEWDLPSAEWHSPELLAWLFNESPCREDVVINDRWGKDSRHKHGSYYTTEYAAGLPNAAHPWEENRGMGHSYGLNRAESLDDYRSGKELLFLLIDTVSRGGNLLLNIGPAVDGTIPVIMQQRLVEIGDWLKINGDAIYGSRYAGRSYQWTEGQRPEQKFGEYMVKFEILDQIGQEPRNGRAVKHVFFTSKPGALYAIVPGWPEQELRLKEVATGPGTRVELLGSNTEVKFRQAGKDTVLDLATAPPATLACQPAYTFKITGATLPAAK